MMNTDLEHWLEVASYCAYGAAFGLAGGLVRVLRKGVRGWLDLLGQIAAAAFCGGLAFALLEGQVDELAMCACAGIAGNSGGMLLDVIRWRLIRRAAGLDAVAVPSSVQEAEKAEQAAIEEATPVEAKDREN